jgi:Na+-transporting NADH:ubiquinone oxidoreductase subunit C
MNRESPLWALLVVTLVVTVSALLVSAAVVLLRPIQQDNQALEQARNVVSLAGYSDYEYSGHAQNESDDLLLSQFRALDARMVDFESGGVQPASDIRDQSLESIASGAVQSTAIPAADDLAGLGARENRVIVYLVWGAEGLERIILPVAGMGMWSTLRGYVVLGPDLNTIVDASIYEQAETPGVGDQITRPDWLAKWRGRKIYDDDGVPQFAVASGKVDPESASALYGVDAITGATVTTDAVTAMVRFWFGPWGYQALLENLRDHPPQPPVATGGDS